jgi:hypothetical protein
MDAYVGVAWVLDFESVDKRSTSLSVERRGTHWSSTEGTKSVRGAS